MEKQKRNPKSKSPSPLPSWMEDQALSRQWEGAVGESDLPLSLTEEGIFLDMDKDWNDDIDQELSRSGNVTRSQDVTLQELYQWEEEVRVRERSQRRARRQRELYQREEKVTVRELSQWRDRRHPELHQREAKVTVQELHQWEEGGVSYKEVTQWEESVTVQELSHLEEKKPPQWLSEWGEELRGQDQNLRRVQRPRELPSLEEDVRGTDLTLRRLQRPRELPSLEEGVRGQDQILRRVPRPRDLSSLEEDVRGTDLTLRRLQRSRERPSWEDARGKELSQSRDVREQELMQSYSAQELPQRERDVSQKKLSQWGADVGYTTWDKALHPGNAGDSQTCPQEGPSSPSSVGTEVAGEAAPELPSSAPAPLSPTDTEPAAAAPARAAEEEKEPQGHLSAEEEKAEGSPAFGEQEPPEGTESDVPAPQSNALLEVQRLSQELEEQRELEQSRAAEMVRTVPSAREESPVPAPQSPVPAPQSPVPAPQSPCSPSSPSTPEVQGQALSGQQEETEGESLLAVQETEEGTQTGDKKDWKSCMEEELSRGEGETNPELCQGTDYSVQELSQGEGEMGPELSQREEDVTCNVFDNALGPVNEEDTHTVPQEGPSSPSCVGTEVAGEAAPELPSSAPAPLSPTDTAQVPSVGSQRPVPVPQSPSEGSQALLDTNQDTSSELLSQAELELQGSSQQVEEERELEESLTAESVLTVSPELPQTPVNTLESISDGIPALMEAEHQIFSEMLGNALLEVQRVRQELEEERDVEQSRAAEMVRTVPSAREESPVPAPQSPVPAPKSPSEGSQALLDTNQDTSSELLSQAELELQGSSQQVEEERELEESLTAESVLTVSPELPQTPVNTLESISDGIPALMEAEHQIFSEMLGNALLEVQRVRQELEEERDVEQSRAAEMVRTVPSEREESPVPAPQSPVPAPQSPVPAPQSPVPAPQGPVPAPQGPSEGSQALLDFAERISTEILSQAELELRRSIQQLQAQRELEQSRAAEVVTTVPVERGERPVPAPQGPSESNQALLDFADCITTEILSQAELELRRSIQQLQAQRELEQSRAAKMVKTVPEEREERPVPAPQGPSESSQALLDFAKLITTEILSQAELELRRSIQQLQAQRHLKQSRAAEVVTTVPEEREESPVLAPQSPVPAPQSPCSPSSPSTPEVPTQILSEQDEDKEAEGESVQALQETQEGALAGEGIHLKYHVDQEASQWEDEEDQELSQEVKTSQEVSQGEDFPEQELFPGQDKHDQKLSDWEEYIEEEEPQGEGKSYQEVSDWEENTRQELSQQEVSGSQVVSDWEEHGEEQLSHGGVSGFQEVSDCEENIKQEQSQREVSGSQGLSDKEHSNQEEQSEGKGGHSPQVWSSSESFSQEESSPGHFSSYQDLLSSWEDSLGQEFSHEDGSMGQEFSDWEEHGGSVLCRWEDERDRELALQYWQQHVTVHTIEVKPFRRQEDECEGNIKEELTQREVSGSQGLSDKEHSKQEEQSEGKGGHSPQVRSSSESFGQEESSPGHFSSYQDLLSSWEDSLGQEFSHEDSSMGQEFSDWEEHRGSVPSRWEDDSDRELALQDWQQHVTVHTIEVKPFRREDDEWEELSVLELPQAEEREERLSVPAPRQAWAERRVSQPCTRVPGWASPPQLQPQAPRGDVAVPRRDVTAPRGDVTAPRGDVTAPRGHVAVPRRDVTAPRGDVTAPRGDVTAPRGDVAAPKKRPSRLRRALRALGRLFRSCLEGQPED
ncbi:uro-adherence factor A-like [Pithys albifrons albifrons]|uniref:uro-adherence factor A-like n=1 Tax=Pithys albifrons albifrons TaxID=3385563 RepID=UPI003A5CBD39